MLDKRKYSCNLDATRQCPVSSLAYCRLASSLAWLVTSTWVYRPKQRSSITFSQRPKAWKIGMVAGHRRETHLKKQNLLLNYKANMISVDI